MALLLGLNVALSPGTPGAQPLAQPRLRWSAPWDQGVTPAQEEDARRRFQAARRHHYAGLVVEAAAEYREALRLWPHPIVHFNLGLALIVLDQPVEADEHLEQALAHGLRGLDGDLPRLEYARQKRLELGRRLATVQVSCRREGAKIFIDREHVLTVEKGRPPMVSKRIRTDKSSVHQLVAEMPDGEAVIEEHVVAPGDTLRIELRARREHRRWRALGWAPWAVVGGGVLVGLAGGALQWSANASYRRFEQQLEVCWRGGQRCEPSRFVHLRDRGDDQRALGFAGYGLAGAAIVAGGVLAYLNRPIARRIGPLVGPGAGGAVVMGRF